MPSAAIKPTPEAVQPAPSSSDGTVPVRQIMKAVEHKIRNLEKRKGKLEGYQDLRRSGKDLSADQEVAISKFDEVVQCLLCAQELLKQIQGIAVLWDKDQKKLMRKETAAKVANEVFKVRETLILQDLLRQLQNSDVRNDFRTGSNGAVKLEPADLALVDKLIAEGFISVRVTDTEESFTATAHRAADHWVSTVDGKPKQFVPGVTYERLRRVVRSIQDCGYFSRRFVAPSESSNEAAQPPPADSLNGDEPTETNAEASQTATPSSDETLSVMSTEAPVTQSDRQATQTGDVNDHKPIPVLQVVQEGPLIGNASGVAQPPLLENNVYFNAFPQQQPMIDPNSLPAELETGAFSFLQDSELDELGVPAAMDHNAAATPNSHPSPVLQQSIPTQPQAPQANLVLINPMISIQPNQSHSFPFPNAAVPSPAQHMNPNVQLFLLNGTQPHRMGGGVPNMGPGNFVAAPATAVPVPENEMRMTAAHPTNNNHTTIERTSPIVSGTEQMTITEWDPRDVSGRKDEDKEQQQQLGHHNHHQQRRENSTESSSTGDRRRDDRRPRQNGQENGGGYGGSRRRGFFDRSNGGANNYNGSRMHRNGTGGAPGVSGAMDGTENGPATNSSTFRAGSGGKPNHFNSSRGSNGQNGAGGPGTFYRNNDPGYYSQNGNKPVRHNAANWKSQQPQHRSGSDQQHQGSYSQSQQA